MSRSHRLRNYASRSVIVVERFTDDVISQALEALLPDIEDFALKKCG